MWSVVGGTETWIAAFKGALERAVQHGGADVEEGLHGCPVAQHTAKDEDPRFVQRDIGR